MDAPSATLDPGVNRRSAQQCTSTQVEGGGMGGGKGWGLGTWNGRLHTVDLEQGVNTLYTGVLVCAGLIDQDSFLTDVKFRITAGITTRNMHSDASLLGTGLSGGKRGKLSGTQAL